MPKYLQSTYHQFSCTNLLNKYVDISPILVVAREEGMELHFSRCWCEFLLGNGERTTFVNGWDKGKGVSARLKAQLALGKIRSQHTRAASQDGHNHNWVVFLIL